LSEEEVTVGIHESGIILQEGANTSLSRNYCANCKRMIHCYVKVDKETKEAKAHITCKSADCECKCRTHYKCKQCGFSHPYGQKICNRTESLTSSYDSETEKEHQKIMSSWRKLQESKTNNIQEFKHS
jgi:hypothetical protein